MRQTLPAPTATAGTVADVDGDGTDDLIAGVGSGANRALEVRLGSPGGPGAPIDTTTGCSMSHIQIADVVGDAEVDAMFRCSGAGVPNGIGLAEGHGDGTFDAHTIVVPPSQGSFTLAQVLGSSELDVVSNSGGTATIFTGAGDGTFTASGVSVTLPDGYPANHAAVGDLEGNGSADLVFTSTTTSGKAPLFVYRSDGAGGFLAPESYPTGLNGQEPTITDLDRDGKADIVAAIASGNTPLAGVMLLKGKGGGLFEDPVVMASGIQHREVAVGDIDGDTYPDVVSNDFWDEVIDVVHGSGSGPLPPTSVIAADSPRTVSLGDLDGDGDLDVASIGSTSSDVSWSIIYNDEGRFRAVAASVVDGAPGSFAPTGIAELTGDDAADAWLVRSSTVAVAPNDGDGDLLAPVTTNLGGPHADAVAADLDEDGHADLLGVDDGDIELFPGNGDGTFSPAVLTSFGTNLRHLVAADIDDDGHLDAVVSDTDDDKVSVLYGDGTGALADPVSVTLAGPTNQLAVADLDDDGHLDIAALGGTGGTVTLLLGRKGRKLQAPTSFAVGTTPTAITARDIDHDHHPDLLVVAKLSGTSTLRTYLGIGDGTFAAPLDQTGVSTERLTTLDLNGDGHLDLSTSSTRWVLGGGDGTWTLATGSTNAFGALARTEAGDLDGDGTPDLAGTCISVAGICAQRVLAAAPGEPERSPFAPFASWGALVDQIYLDLLQRPPSDAERTADVAALTDASLTPGGLVARIRASSEHTTNVDPVARLYTAYFLRPPDPSGLDFWVKRRRAGWTLIRISNNFAGSSEFQAKYGALTNAQFVDLVYQNVLGRPGDVGGRAFWIGRLDRRTVSRGQVMLNFSDSNEYRTKQAAEVDVGVLSAWMLRRRPTTAELTASVSDLDDGDPLSAVADRLIRSDAYAARIGG